MINLKTLLYLLITLVGWKSKGVTFPSCQFGWVKNRQGQIGLRERAARGARLFTLEQREG